MRKFGIIAAVALLLTTSAKAQKNPGVHPDSSPVQIGLGFTFVSFNEVPSTVANNVGVEASAVYYHDRVGVETDLSDAFGSQNGKNTQVLFTGGGARLRWPTGRAIVPWIHGDVGYSHLSPDTSYGSASAFGYKAGGGLDINPRCSRLSFRVSADMLGTHFFHTYQISPEISAGMVFSISRE